MKNYLPLLLLLATMACTNDNEEELYADKNVPCSIEKVSYQLDIKPILQQACYGCHANGFNSGNVALDTHQEVKKAAAGPLLPAINHQPGYTAMPLGGKKLPACDIAKIKMWIELGSPDN